MAERILFDCSLYLPDAIDAAAAAYAGYAIVEVTRGDGAIAVDISPVGSHDAHELAHAFSNHVLHETIARIRRTAVDEGA
jgi:hypothetical protein